MLGSSLPSFLYDSAVLLAFLEIEKFIGYFSRIDLKSSSVKEIFVSPIISSPETIHEYISLQFNTFSTPNSYFKMYLSCSQLGFKLPVITLVFILVTSLDDSNISPFNNNNNNNNNSNNELIKFS